MTPAEHINDLHTVGIRLYVRGEHEMATRIWIEAQEFAAAAAKSAGINIDARFLSAESWTNGIGHIALLDFFAKRRLLGLCNDHYVVLVKAEAVANKFYLDLWKRYFVFVEESHNLPEHISFLQDYPMVLKLNGEFVPFMDALYDVVRKWSELNRPPLLKLPDEQIMRGWEKLAQIGIPQDRWFVTIHVRENGMVSGTVDDTTSIRNSNLADYAPAVAAIVEAGGHPIRIDNIGASAPVPGLIDLAGSPDWFYAFLLSQCRFFMGMNSGPAWVAGTFGVPALLTNWAPSALRYGYPRSRVMAKKLRRLDGWTVVGQPLDGKLTYIESGNILARMGVEAVPTSPLEIRDAVIQFMREEAVQ